MLEKSIGSFGFQSSYTVICEYIMSHWQQLFFQLLTIVVPKVVMAHALLMYTSGPSLAVESLGEKVEKFL